MLSEGHETMCCAHCGPGPEGRETLVRINCDGEKMIMLLNRGWTFQFMVIDGPHLDLEVYCPTCSIKAINMPTLNNIKFAKPIVPQCNCELSHPRKKHDETCSIHPETYVAKCQHCNIVWPVHSKENPTFIDHPKNISKNLHSTNFIYKICKGSEREALQVYKNEDYPYDPNRQTIGGSGIKTNNSNSVSQHEQKLQDELLKYKLPSTDPR